MLGTQPCPLSCCLLAMAHHLHHMASLGHVGFLPSFKPPLVLRMPVPLGLCLLTHLMVLTFLTWAPSDGLTLPTPIPPNPSMGSQSSGLASMENCKMCLGLHPLPKALEGTTPGCHLGQGLSWVAVLALAPRLCEDTGPSPKGPYSLEPQQWEFLLCLCTQSPPFLVLCFRRMLN